MLLSQASWNLWNFARETEDTAGIMVMRLTVMHCDKRKRLKASKILKALRIHRLIHGLSPFVLLFGEIN